MQLMDIIRQYRIEHNLSQREFAERCDNITHGYISMIENNLNKSTGKPPRPSVEKLESIARGMGMTFEQLREMMNDGKPSYFAGGTGTPMTASPSILRMIEDAIRNVTPYTPPTAMVPIVGTVRCGSGGLAYEDLQGAELADVSNLKDYFWLRAEGDSMSPNILPGDLVLVHIQPEVESGDLAVVLINGEEGALKKFIRKDNAVILQSFNQAYSPRVFVGDEMNTLRIAGRVVETKRKW